MPIGKQIIKVVFFSITLLFSMLVFRQSHKAYITGEDEYIYGQKTNDCDFSTSIDRYFPTAQTND